ncbi:MAG: hypothetical protein AAF938_15965 [Myxococcota bacterium]
MLRASFAIVLCVAAGCSEPTPVDVRFITPLATVETLFDAYGVAELSQAEVDRRIAIGRTFHLNDPAALRACFIDWNSAEDEALAGYVFGNIVMAKDVLTATLREDEAEVMIDDPERRTRPVVLVRDGGHWRISLARSVPESVRRELRSMAEERP